MKYLVFLIILIASYAWASPTTDFYSAYENGDYDGALKITDQMILSKKTVVDGYYLRGLIQSRLTSFTQAEISFSQAFQMGARQKDIHYLRGQALFAINRDTDALNSFDKSIKSAFKVRECLYYKGVIYQKRGDIVNAKKIFLSLLTYGGAEIPLRQSTMMRLSEIAYERALKTPVSLQENITGRVIPLLEKALALDPDSQSGKMIAERITLLKNPFAPSSIILKNSRSIPLSPWQAFLSLEGGYDSNVILESNDAVVAATYKGSSFFKLMTLVNYRFIFKNEFLVSPEFRIDRTIYTRRNVHVIIENDYASFSPAVRTTYEHTLAGRVASLLADVETNYTEQDRNSEENLVFYGRSIAFFFGEKIKTLLTGETSLRLKLKKYWSAIEGEDTNTSGIILEQSWISPQGSLLLADIIADFNKLASDYNSYNNYEARVWYRLPLFAINMDMTLGLSVLLTDTLNQRELRGIETEITPSVKLTRTVFNSFFLSPRYEYTKKSSKDKANYAFTRHVVSLEFGMDF